MEHQFLEVFKGSNVQRPRRQRLGVTSLHSRTSSSWAVGGGSADVFSLLTSNRACRNEVASGGKRQGERVFMKRVVSHWNRVPREVVVAPSLLRVQGTSGNTLIHMVYF